MALSPAEKQRAYRARRNTGNAPVTPDGNAVTPDGNATHYGRPISAERLRAMVESLHSRRHLTMTGRREMLDWIEG